MEAGLPPGVANDEVVNGSKLYDAFRGHLRSNVELEIEFGNESGEVLTLLIGRDAETELARISGPHVGHPKTLYTTSNAAAVRNHTSGTVRYFTGEVFRENLLFETGYAGILFVTLGNIRQYVSVLEWQVTDTNIVDGEQYYVLESDSINQTAVERSKYDLDEGNESVGGRLVVRSDGFIREGQLQVLTSAGNGWLTLTVHEASDVTVERPDWFDVSKTEDDE